MRCPSCDHDNIQGVDFCEECGLDLAGLDVKAWGMDPDDPMLGRPVRELPLKRAPVLRADTTVAAAVEAMRERREGCAFVVDFLGRLVGVFTERDLAARVADRRRDPERTPLEEVMTAKPATLLEDDPLAWALHRMGVDGHRHLPVLDQEEGLVGMLSMRTVLRAFLDA